MSYDIWLEADLGGSEPVKVGNLDWNYTSNCVAMWRRAMPETDGLAGMAGMTAREASAVLEKGIERMEANRWAYMELDPPSGWGSYATVVPALRQLLEAFRGAPDAKVAISR